MPRLLTLPGLHELHARQLTIAADCRRDYAKGGTIWHPAELALLEARSFLDAAKNVRNVIENRRGK